MTTDIWSPSFVRDLSDAQLAEFQEIVLKDVKNRIEENDTSSRTILVNNLDLWLYSLQVLRREIELQLSQHKGNLQIKLAEMRATSQPKSVMDDAVLSEQRWRNNAMKFLTAIERRTLYVKLLLAEEDTEE